MDGRFKIIRRKKTSQYACIFVLYYVRIDLFHIVCAHAYIGHRSRGALFLDNRRDFTEMGQTDFKPFILSM